MYNVFICFTDTDDDSNAGVAVAPAVVDNGGSSSSVSINVIAPPSPSLESPTLYLADNPSPEDRRIRTMVSQIAFEAARKVQEKLSPGMRRKLALTPELSRKSDVDAPMGRREVDISHKFLRSFSETSSESEDEDMIEECSEEDEFFTGPSITNMQTITLEMAPVEKRNLSSKLSVITEDTFEDCPEVPTPSQAKVIQRPEALKKLKLIIQPQDDLDSDFSVKLDTGTPITPGKYSANWDGFGADTPPQISSTADPELSHSSSSDSDAEAGISAHAASIVSPGIKSRKMDRRSAVKKRKTSNSPPSSSFNMTPSTLPLSPSLSPPAVCMSPITGSPTNNIDIFSFPTPREQDSDTCPSSPTLSSSLSNASTVEGRFHVTLASYGSGSMYTNNQLGLTSLDGHVILNDSRPMAELSAEIHTIMDCQGSPGFI